MLMGMGIKYIYMLSCSVLTSLPHGPSKACARHNVPLSHHSQGCVHSKLALQMPCNSTPLAKSMTPSASIHTNPHATHTTGLQQQQGGAGCKHKCVFHEHDVDHTACVHSSVARVRYSAAFYVRYALVEPWPCPDLHQDARKGCTVPWRGDVKAAWLKAKLVAGWEAKPLKPRRRLKKRRA